MTQPQDSQAATPDEWVDPGFLDRSIWDRENPPRSASRWVKRGILVAIASILICSWFSSLWGLPDPGRPAGYDAWLADSAPDEENAAYYYRVAIDAIPKRRIPLSPPTDWIAVDDRDREWLKASARPLLVWREGTKRSTADSRSGRPEVKALNESEIRSLTRLALLKALQYENISDFDEAFDWYLAVLRFSRHLGRNVGVHDRFRSIPVYQAAASRILPWSDQPNLHADLLRFALEEVRELREIDASPSESLYVELSRVEQALENVDALDDELRLDALNRQLASLASWERALSRLSRWYQREPERSRRVIRLLVANWERAFQSGSFRQPSNQYEKDGIFVFQTSPADRSPTALAARAGQTRYARHLLPFIQGFVTTITEDERNQSELERQLAEKLFIRLKGRRSTSPEELRQLDQPPADAHQAPEEKKSPSPGIEPTGRR